MTNNRNKKRRPTKAKPVESEIRRAAKRAGIKPADPSEALTPEDKAIIDGLARDGLRSAMGGNVVGTLRRQGLTNDGIAGALRGEAHMFKRIAERLTPGPETRDDMLTDALEIVDAASAIFYVQGSDDTDPVCLMDEALHSLEQDLDNFAMQAESSDQDVDWQAFWRASYRAKLARKLAEFRRTHGVYKPQQKDESAEGSKVANCETSYELENRPENATDPRKCNQPRILQPAAGVESAEGTS